MVIEVTVRANRILIWRFSAAPTVLQLLCKRTESPPEWLVFIPQSMSNIDFDALILERAQPGCVARYKTATGDVVYAGTSDTCSVAKALAYGNA